VEYRIVWIALPIIIAAVYLNIRNPSNVAAVIPHGKQPVAEATSGSSHWENNNNMTLNALIFDVDGTLAETEEAHREAFNLAFKEFGLDWSWNSELYTELLNVTGGHERILFYVRDKYPDLFDQPGFTERAREIHRFKTGRYGELLSSGSVKLLPGVERLLNEAREDGLRLAIATTTNPDNVRALLEPNLGAQAMDWFEVIGAGDCVPAKKPAPDIYQWVLERMDLPASQCLALEDSRNGLRSAMGAGIATLITPSIFTRHNNFAGAALILNNLGEPGQPFEVIEGDAGEHTHVTPAMLRQMLA